MLEDAVGCISGVRGRWEVLERITYRSAEHKPSACCPKLSGYVQLAAASVWGVRGYIRAVWVRLSKWCPGTSPMATVNVRRAGSGARTAAICLRRLDKAPWPSRCGPCAAADFPHVLPGWMGLGAGTQCIQERRLWLPVRSDHGAASVGALWARRPAWRPSGLVCCWLAEELLGRRG